ncbi:GNAT family N-acetyltransferase [Micromonospora sp. WMMA1363]|uniref:GNAT family N-acetyltransferase n=1 Tax=Micromonospora sp. WMMA1363 TaxID=3053985 RepID=UPI00259C7C76|nr:GNAT family N-acetyltransferase [Micromonospora sp. WMMA1363]MDM4721185.1 GNAT family N-acetyltransferase [Micromonospora sp. WMMA1363]
MDPVVVLRDMRQDEYDVYSEQQIREYVESLATTAPYEVSVEKARQDRATFLPRGLATEGHYLLVAENDAGQVVGSVWLGLADPRTGSTEMAWLFDIRVESAHRRSGYGAAILGAAEALAREAGARRLGLNVFGDNAAAIALYERSGYQVTTQQMAKRLRSGAE